MLTSCRIKNIAIIEDATIEFAPGFNVLSGETGGGKSIIVQALQIIFGERGSSELIREGADEAVVEAAFDLGFTSEVDRFPPPRCGGPHLGGGNRTLVVKRSLSAGGKNKVYINGSPATLQMLTEVVSPIVDLASQHEHQILLCPEKHLGLLDSFIGHISEEQIGKPVCTSEVKKGFEKYRELLGERDGLVEKNKRVGEEEEFLRFQLREIESADLKDGEEEELKKEREVAKNAVRLGGICLKGEEIISSGASAEFSPPRCGGSHLGGENSVLGALAGFLRELGGVAEIDDKLKNMHDLGESAKIQLGELADGLQKFAKSLKFNPDRLEEIEDRLHLISGFKKKYGDVASAIEKRSELKKNLAALESFDDELSKKNVEIESAGKELLSLASALSKKRKEKASVLATAVEKEITGLGFGKTKFDVRFLPPPDAILINGDPVGANGLESVEFYFEPNVGEGLRPIAKIASGGELSRLLLAVKRVLGRSRKVATYVFDEVDSGIGGGIAEVVGKKLAELAHGSQVICVTHLPQIASLAKTHFSIRKETKGGRTRTVIDKLESDGREEEIARMLAGVKISAKAREHAREMLACRS